MNQIQLLIRYNRKIINHKDYLIKLFKIKENFIKRVLISLIQVTKSKA